MKFKYKKYGHILRPVIEIRVKNSEASIRYEVLVDSGADICLFSAAVGEAIGIDVESGRKNEVMGVGGKFSVYYIHPITIEVGGWSYAIDAGFMPDVAGHVMPYGIVGQKGFFDNFVIKFDLLKEEVEFKRRA
jgi:hypothetical protein